MEDIVLKALGELVVNPLMILVRSVDLNGSMGPPNPELWTAAGKYVALNILELLFAGDGAPKAAG
jgi:hypothetical protein